MDNNRNTLLAIALSLLVLLGWQFLYVNPKLDAERKAAEIERVQKSGEQGGAPAVQPGAQTAQPGQPTTAVPGSGLRCPELLACSRKWAGTRRWRSRRACRSRTATSSDSINLKGGRIDDLRLKNYRVTIDRNSPLVTLLSPADLRPTAISPNSAGSASATSGEVPGPETMWTAPRGAAAGPGNARHAHMDKPVRRRLHPHHRARRALHVHGQRQGRQRHGGGSRDVALWPRHALRQAACPRPITCCTKA